MNFLININKNQKTHLKEISGRLNSLNSSESFLYIPEVNLFHKEYISPDAKLFVLGDFITDSSNEDIMDAVRTENISDFGGFFYLIYINSITHAIKIFSSLFNILPVYYYENSNNIIVSSRMEYIVSLIGNTGINKNYILERILFNYAFSNDTIYSDVYLLPSNHFVEINDKKRIKKHFEITDHFVDDPRSGKNVLEDISERFIHTASKYFPEESAVSFTSGFDGRTLVSIGKKLDKNFFAYSFGSKNSIDLSLPIEQAKNINLNFIPFTLDQEYVSSHSLECGLDLISKTEGNASFARAHYRYATKLLSERSRYIITGNFGSELFRAFHNPGVVVSKEMFSFFGSENEEWINEISTSQKLNYLKAAGFKSELQDLITALKEYKSGNKNLSKNSFFYKYIFEEVFRKYFGPEIVMQSYFLMNRTPYLDPGFIKYLLSTKYAGVYSDYATANPLKRFKGQLPYAYIIKNSYPPLMEMITGKGYRPVDLLSISGKLKIVMAKLNKNSSTEDDPFSVSASFNHNKEYFSSIKINKELFNGDLISNFLSNNKISDLDNIIHLLSVNYYLNKFMV